MNDEFQQTAIHTVTFLRMASAELRRIAERTPEVAAELRRMAAQFDADGAALARQIPGFPRYS